MGIDSWLWSRLDLKHALIALGAIPWCPKTRSRPFALINRASAGVLSYGSAHVGTGLMASGCCACCA